jgi:hypothetical protein
MTKKIVIKSKSSWKVNRELANEIGIIDACVYASIERFKKLGEDFIFIHEIVNDIPEHEGFTRSRIRNLVNLGLIQVDDKDNPKFVILKNEH